MKSILILVVCIIGATTAASANQYLDFDGNDRVVIPDSASLNPSTELTVELRVNFGRLAWGGGYTPTENQFLVCKGGDNDNQAYRISQGGTSTTPELSFHIGERYTPGQLTAAAPLVTDQWYHIAGTYDGDYLSLYLDGVLIGQEYGPGAQMGSPAPLTLGYNDFGSWTWQLTGALDEIRIWDFARSQTEIQATMNQTLTGLEAGLIGYWDFEEQLDSQLAIDNSIYGNTGQLGSTPGVDDHDPARIADLATLLVSVDIRPGNDINPVNLKSNGVLPVAILGAEDFDVTLIDLESLVMAGSSPKPRGRSGNIGSFRDVNGDSIIDLVLNFDLSELDAEPSVTELTLLGLLQDGTDFEGADSIRIVPPGDLNGDLVVDIIDLTSLAANWSTLSGGAKGWAEGDYNGDSVVDIVDLTALAANWGAETIVISGGPVPEPTALALLALGGFALIRRRRK